MFDNPVPLFADSEPPRRPRYGRRILLALGVAAGIGFGVYEHSDIMYGRAPRPERAERGRPRGRNLGARSMYQSPRVGAAVTPDQVQRYPDAPLYDPRTLRTVFLQFERSNWEEELASRYHTDRDLPATVTIDGTAYREVG